MNAAFSAYLGRTKILVISGNYTVVRIEDKQGTVDLEGNFIFEPKKGATF
ncbi:MAG: hypothetical protein ACK5MG_04095 [Bacteroidales bacterium]